MAAELSEDAFLGGRLRLMQPRKGYRAGLDAVLLAASVPAQSGEAVLELGLGAGTASLCLGARVGGLMQVGMELQADYADLARQNAAANGIALEVIEGDIATMPKELLARSFDHVLMNPPYFRPEAGAAAHDAGREAALRETQPLASWLVAAARRLRPGGMLSVIQRIERLPDLISALPTSLGSLEIKPVQPREDRAAGLVILRAKKGGRAAFRLHAPLILHRGDHHEADAESYRPEVQAILRTGAPLNF